MQPGPRTRTRAAAAFAVVAAVVSFGAVGVAGSAAAGTSSGVLLGESVAPVSSVKKASRGLYPGMTASQIMARGRVAMAQSTSVHVVGSVVSEGKQMGVDLKVGKDANGTLSWARGGAMTVRRVGARLWLRPDDAYYIAHKHPELISQRHATWIEITPGDPDYPLILPLTQLSTWRKAVGGVAVSARKPGATFTGRPTVALLGKAGAKGPIVYVAGKGASLPLYVASRDKTDHLALQDWNVPFTVAEPTPAHVLPELPDAVVDVPADPADNAAALTTIWPA